MGTHKKKCGKQKLHKLKLLSSTKGEENRIVLQTAVNQKLRKSKPRKSRNTCTNFFFLKGETIEGGGHYSRGDNN